MKLRILSSWIGRGVGSLALVLQREVKDALVRWEAVDLAEEHEDVVRLGQ